MPMSSKIRGWQDVFVFTLKQTVKSKSFIVSMIIMAVMFFAMVPIMSGGKGGIAGDMTTVEIDKIYYCDETSLIGDKLGDSLVKCSEDYEDTKFEKIADKDSFVKCDDCDDSVLVMISTEDGIINMEVVRSENSNVGDMDAGLFSEDLESVTRDTLAQAANITEEQLNFITSENVIKSGKVIGGKLIDDEEDDDSGMGNNFISTSALGMMIFMMTTFILAMGGEAASTSMITEKGSRAIEYVLTSIKPMALITGKLLACVVTQFIQVCMVLLCGGISVFVFTQTPAKMTTTKELINSIGVGNIADEINAARIALALLIFACGIIFYLMIACLVGSTASRMEELTQTNMVYSIILVIGAYMAMFFMMSNSGADSVVGKVFLAFPLSAPFMTPVFVVTGKCAVATAAVSLGVMMVAIAILILFVSRVFESVIMYNGSKVTFAKMLEFAGLKKPTANVVKGGGADE